MNTKEAACSCKGKSLDHFLQPTILMLLKNEEMHGFLLLKKISETPLFAGEYPDPTGLYRFLKKMEAQGMLSSREELQKDFPSKKMYSITAYGSECLENWEQTIRQYAEELLQLTDLISKANNKENGPQE